MHSDFQHERDRLLFTGVCPACDPDNPGQMWQGVGVPGAGFYQPCTVCDGSAHMGAEAAFIEMHEQGLATMAALITEELARRQAVRDMFDEIPF